jgi:hypothetical protein
MKIDAFGSTGLVAGAAGTLTKVTLDGKGEVTLDDSFYTTISGAGFDAPVVTLVNLDNTIDGSGTIGSDGLKTPRFARRYLVPTLRGSLTAANGNAVH